MFIEKRFLCSVATAGLLFIAPAQSVHANPPKAGAKTRIAIVKTETPENTLRSFLIALVSQDAKTLRRVTLPLGEDNFAYLVETPPVPLEVQRDAKVEIQTMLVQPLKPGQSFRTPSGKTVTVAPGAVGAKRVLLLPAKFPMAVALEKVNGNWRVDAAPVVASLKEAKRKRQNRLKHLQHFAADSTVSQ